MDKPAFPQPDGWGLSEDAPYAPARCDGLTRRELFAAMAMQGLLANGGQAATAYEDAFARLCIEHADALIAELDKEAVDAD